MTNAKFISFYIILFSTLFIACTTPKKAYEKGHFGKAIKLSTKEIEKGNNKIENYTILKKSSIRLVKNSILKNNKLEKSQKVKDWIKAQGRYYNVLTDLGKANIATDGLIDSTYDIMCSRKITLDNKIIDFYYKDGLKLLKRSKETGTKSLSRQAYVQFSNCTDFGGKEQYSDIDQLLKNSRKLGVVYYTATGLKPKPSFWIKPFNSSSPNDKVDCVMKSQIGTISTDESQSFSSQSYFKKIKTGTKPVADTSNNITYKDVYEEVSATVTTTTTTVTATITTQIIVRNITGECNMKSSTFDSHISNSYKEVSISGNEKAIDFKPTENEGAPSFFYSDLKNELINKVKDDLKSF